MAILPMKWTAVAIFCKSLSEQELQFVLYLTVQIKDCDGFDFVTLGDIYLVENHTQNN